MSTALIDPPSRLAVAIACSPTTPMPITSTFAALIVPMAVPIVGMNLGNRLAAISTPL